MPATVRQYELVYIVSPDRSDEHIQGVIDKYNNIITTQGGEVERTDIWERRRLAYPIKGQTEGIYVVCIFRGLPPVEAELRRVFGISEDTIRFIIVRPDDEIDASIPTVAPREFGGSRAPYSGPFNRRCRVPGCNSRSSGSRCSRACCRNGRGRGGGSSCGSHR